MSYERKEYITQFFDSVHQAEELNELHEVYAKAQAFDGYLSIKSERPTFLNAGSPLHNSFTTSLL